LRIKKIEIWTRDRRLNRTKMKPDLSRLDASDWQKVLKYRNLLQALPGQSVLVDFEIEEIEDIISLSEGTPGKENWLLILRLQFNRFAAVFAGYSIAISQIPWEDQWGGCIVSEDLESVLEYGLTSEERWRLKVPLVMDHGGENDIKKLIRDYIKENLTI